jgi:glycosyltransferase involved in cell wall biosynthesis
MNFKTILTLHDYFSACPNGGFYDYKKKKICKLNPMSLKCIMCNCDSRNYAFKLFRIIRQFIQNNLVKLSKNISKIIYVSQFSKQIMHKRFINVDSSIISNPISIKKPDNRVACENNDKYIFLGRLDSEKGIEMFCEAITNMNLNGIVVGTGKLYNILKKKYNNIEFVGWKNANEIEKILSKVRVLIFPSLLYETMGLTVLEAQIMGIPVICNNITSAIDYIKNDYNGYIFNNSSLNSLQQKISYCCENSNIKRLSINSFNDLKVNSFISENYFEKLIDFYDKN